MSEGVDYKILNQELNRLKHVKNLVKAKMTDLLLEEMTLTSRIEEIEEIFKMQIRYNEGMKRQKEEEEKAKAEKLKKNKKKEDEKK